jgi:predicted CXXCH cytochrome family protein
VGCHQQVDEDLARFSLHRPFAAGECSSCHNPHQAPGKGLLRKNAERGELCLSCHKTLGDKAPGKGHPPFVQGACLTCHAPHAADHSFVQKQKPGELCLSCHSSVAREMSEKKHLHEPLRTGHCASCHLAHGSGEDAHLLRGRSELCLSCHQEVAAFWDKGVAHAPARQDCGLCHLGHGGSEPALLKAARAELCLTCHQSQGEGFARAHGGLAPSGRSCLSCHDPHGAPAKGLIYPVQHAPFQQGQCKECHPGRKN